MAAERIIAKWEQGGNHIADAGVLTDHRPTWWLRRLVRRNSVV